MKWSQHWHVETGWNYVASAHFPSNIARRVQAAIRGAIVLTGNTLAARFLQAECDKELGEGAKAWKTPDILPFHLQSGEPWVFKSRLALAATLSASYGIYNGFELIEHTPIPGREEYLDSEKYEIKIRDWNKPGHIKDYIREINRIRHANPALLQTSDVRFVPIDHPDVIGFVKESPDRKNAVAIDKDLPDRAKKDGIS